ncbi:MAG: small multi-drug export protein [Deltaproteobacteria bacterium]|nr:small multi-drug export protein [Deltaproteobacteria bacterium]
MMDLWKKIAGLCRRGEPVPQAVAEDERQQRQDSGETFGPKLALAKAPEKSTKTLYRSGEGRVFLTGLLLTVIFIALVIYSLMLDIRVGQTLLLAFVAHTLGGRAAGIGLCIAFGFSGQITILYNMFLEVLIVCYCYSLFVFSFNNYLKCKWLTVATINAEKQALKHKKTVSRYGWLGLFTFVMVPLPITGPAAGSIIAYFLKFSVLRNFSAVFSGTLVSIIVWTCFFDYLDRHIAIFKYVMLAVLIVFFFRYFKTIKSWFTQPIDE